MIDNEINYHVTVVLGNTESGNNQLRKPRIGMIFENTKEEIELRWAIHYVNQGYGYLKRAGHKQYVYISWNAGDLKRVKDMRTLSMSQAQWLQNNATNCNPSGFWHVEW